MKGWKRIISAAGITLVILLGIFLMAAVMALIQQWFGVGGYAIAYLSILCGGIFFAVWIGLR